MTDKYQNLPYLKKKIAKAKYRDIELIKLISKSFRDSFAGNVLDVGCASGDFIFNLRKYLPNSNFTGIDVFEDIIKLAKQKGKRFHNCNFYKHDLLKYRVKKKFDIIIASGFLSFFGDFTKPLNKLISLLKKNSESKLFIFGRFNSSNIDTIIKIRNHDFDQKWRDGFTSYSINTVSKFLNKKKLKFIFKKFNLPISIKQTKNLTRSYTIKTKNKKKIIVNKANIIAEFYFLTISKKKF